MNVRLPYAARGSLFGLRCTDLNAYVAVTCLCYVAMTYAMHLPLRSSVMYQQRTQMSPFTKGKEHARAITSILLVKLDYCNLSPLIATIAEQPS